MTAARPRDRVSVYDSNLNNPYGVELAAMLHGDGVDVELVHARGSEPVADSSLPYPVEASLAGDRSRWPAWRYVWHRLAGPMALVRHRLRGRSLVVVWMRDPWEAVLLLVLARVGRGSVFLVHHNPTSMRKAAREGLARWENRLLSRVHVCVHTSAIAEHVTGVPDLHVTPHPPYAVTAALAPPRAPQERHVGFVGAVRSDKGADLLATLFASLPSDVHLTTIGKGEVAGLDAARYRASGKDGPLKQRDFLEEVSSVELVVAPYTESTESGSALMCLALGVPLLALRSPATSRMLNDRSLFDSVEDLALGVGAYLDDPWPTYRLDPSDQLDQSSTGWKEALRCPRC